MLKMTTNDGMWILALSGSGALGTEGESGQSVTVVTDAEDYSFYLDLCLADGTEAALPLTRTNTGLSGILPVTYLQAGGVRVQVRGVSGSTVKRSSSVPMYVAAAVIGTEGLEPPSEWAAYESLIAGYAEDAESAASSVSGKSEQIDTNTAGIAELREQAESCFAGQKTFWSGSDFNDALGNRFYCVNDTIYANMPEESKGNLFTFYRNGGQTAVNGGDTQLYQTMTGTLYIRRTVFSSPVAWSAWVRLANGFQSMGLVTADTLASCDDALGNRVYMVNDNAVANTPSGLKGVLLTFSRADGQSARAGDVQLYSDSAGTLYHRYVKWTEGVNWSDWMTVHSASKDTPIAYTGREISMFSKVLCIGDSTTAGVCNFYEKDESGAYVLNQKTPFPAYAYPAQLARLTGLTATNIGIAGATTKIWAAYGTGYIKSDHDLCIIALGINDFSYQDSEGNADGAVSKAKLKEIIAAVREKNSGIPIFIQSVLPCYYQITARTAYYRTINERWQEVCAEVENCWYIDISTTNGRCIGASYVQGHPTALGYHVLAEDLAAYISYIIHNNPSGFKNTQFIGTEYVYPAPEG